MKTKLSYRFFVAILSCILSMTFLVPAFAETESYGPGSPGNWSKNSQATLVEPLSASRQGESLGMFSTTGYCNCSQCSGGHNLTYSGTVPTANHTISADLDKFPLGTKLMINGVIYTVEDKGSAVRGNILDIYYDNHEQALAHGRQTYEVFAVVEDPAAQ